MIEEISPLKQFKQILSTWWVILAGMVLGGMIALGISRINQPEYQAEAVLHATIDFREINFENLVNELDSPYTWTQYDEDLALEMVKSVLMELTHEMYAYARQLDPTLTADQFNHDYTIERTFANWYIRYRHADPAIAQNIVNQWVAAGMPAIRSAQDAERFEPYVMVELIQTADLPSQPRYALTAQLVLAGMGIGFITSLFLIQPIKNFQQNRVKETAQG